MIIPIRLVWVSATGGTFAPYPQPHALPQGIDVTYEFEVVNELGQPVNITGWTFEYTLKEDTDDLSGVIDRAGFVVDAPNGKARATIAPSDTITQVVPELLPRSGPYVAGVKAVRPGPFTEELMPASAVTLGPPVGTPALTPTPAPSPGVFIAGALQVRTVGLVDVPMLSGPLTVNGIPLLADQLALLTAQASSTQNGIWQVKADAWIRPTAFPSGFAAAGVMVMAQEGTDRADTLWVCSSDKPDDLIDTDLLTFKQIGGTPPIGVLGAVDVEDPIGSLVRRRLTSDDIDPPFSIGFSGGPGSHELGSVAVNPSFSASYSAAIASATLNDGAGALPITLPATSFSYDGGGSGLPARSYVGTGINSSKSWTLTATKVGGTPVRTASVSANLGLVRAFFNSAAAPGVYDEAFIEGLMAGRLQTGYNSATYAFTPGASQYLFACLAEGWGSPGTWKDQNNDDFPMTKVATGIAVSNAFAAIPGGYDVWRSPTFIFSNFTLAAV